MSKTKDYNNAKTSGNTSFRIKIKKRHKKIKNNNINIKSDNFPPKKKLKKTKFKLNKPDNCEDIDNRGAKSPVFIDKNFLNFSDIELNSMKYKKALIYDKRTFMQYYSSLLKKNHLVFFSFYCQKDYNPQIIKNKANLILSKLKVLFILLSKFLLLCLFFNFMMSFSDKAKYNINAFIASEIKEE